MALMTTESQQVVTDLWPAVLLPPVTEAHAAQLAALPERDWMRLVERARQRGVHSHR